MSGSLLLIAAVWLLLLAPLVLRKQSPVRRTSKAINETRVLHEGGTAWTSRRKRLRPAEGHYLEDDDEDLELVEAEPDFVFEDDEPTERDGSARKVTQPAENSSPSAPAEEESDNTPTGEEDEVEDKGQNHNEPILTGEIIEGEVCSSKVLDAAEPAGQPDNSEPLTGSEDEPNEGESSHRSIETEDVDEPQGIAIAASTLEEDSEEDEESDDQRRLRPLRAVSDAYLRGSDVLATEAPSEDLVGTHQASKELELREEEAEPSEADMDYVARRRGRGVYDPVASKALAERRLRRRKQTLSVLIAVCVVSIAAGVFFGNAAWLAVVASLGLTLFYLYNLRRQAMEESELRRRRLARMRRARVGVRNTEDAELGVPDRLRRPGATIVETDDPGAEFEHLNYISGADFFGDDYRGDDYRGDESHYGARDGEAYDDYVERGGYADRAHIRAV